MSLCRVPALSTAILLAAFWRFALAAFATHSEEAQSPQQPQQPQQERTELVAADETSDTQQQQQQQQQQSAPEEGLSTQTLVAAAMDDSEAAPTPVAEGDDGDGVPKNPVYGEDSCSDDADTQEFSADEAALYNAYAANEDSREAYTPTGDEDEDEDDDDQEEDDDDQEEEEEERPRNGARVDGSGELHAQVRALLEATRDIPARTIFHMGPSVRSRSDPFHNRDLERYRDQKRYEADQKDPHINCNYGFYTNTLPSQPDNLTVEEMHEQWWGQMKILERKHGYIQWLFPIHELGMNFLSNPLQQHEKTRLLKDKAAMKRLVRSYELMLDFFGFTLVDENTGEIALKKGYQPFIKNLNTYSHNYLRITRILKCLGLFKKYDLQVGFLVGLVRVMIVNDLLRNARSSCALYWSEAVLRDNDREAIQAIILKYSDLRPKGTKKSEKSKAAKGAKTNARSPVSAIASKKAKRGDKV